MDDSDDLSQAKHRWPDVPRTCFAPGDLIFDADIRWVQLRKFQGYVEGYRQAACALFERATAFETRMNPSYVIFPLAFLWRHHLELAMKDIIVAGCQLEGEDEKFPLHHRLVDIWNVALPHIVACGSEDDPVLKNVEDCLQQFEKIDPGWANAVGFRYPVGKDGSSPSLVDAPRSVNLHGLQRAMLELATFFECVRLEQQTRIDWMQDQHREY